MGDDFFQIVRDGLEIYCRGEEMGSVTGGCASRWRYLKRHALSIESVVGIELQFVL